MGRNPYLDIGRRLSYNDKTQINNAIAAAGLEQLRHTSINRLSGGERQRAYLAMILAQNTRAVILDEPTTYMDMENEAEFLALTERLKTVRKKTVMVVMHNLSKAVELADNILVLDKGEAVFFGAARQCVEERIIEKVFGVQRSFYNIGDAEKTIYYYSPDKRG